jgi:hypothetical protein
VESVENDKAVSHPSGRPWKSIKPVSTFPSGGGFAVKALCYGVIFLLPCALVAQSKESGDKNRATGQVGAEFSVFNPDFYCPSSSPFHCGGAYSMIKGVGVFADYNFTRWGAEGEARWVHWDGYQGQVESTYLIGPRYRVYTWRKVGLWAKFLVGVGGITTAGYPGPDTLKGTLFVYAPGASVDYALNRRFSVRGDYEVQRWPSFAVLPPDDNGLLPSGFSIGAAYTFLTR